MKLLYNLLKEMVAIPLEPRELASRLSLAGVAIDSIEETPAGPVLDAEITTNRPDLLGHLGVAREVAAILRAPFHPAEPQPVEAAERAESAARVEITCPDLCGRFTARVLRDVKIGPSPDWLRQRMEALGQGSISNVVDATNYVMFELGHPLHAFDLDTLAEKRIVVRRAHPGEKLRTLDGIERTLAPEMCVVADARRAAGIGGVMGGAETEISSGTRNLLLECAWFNPISIRRTSKALGLRTEASIRFERCADPEMPERASRRCAQLIQEIAGGEVLAGVVDVYPGRQKAAELELTRKELLRVMGADVPDTDVEAILRALGFAVERTDANRAGRDSLVAAWRCPQPSWRHDVAREVDLIEEVARHYGFDKFPPRLPAARQPARRMPHAEAEDRLRERLLALGYQEAMSIPFVDEPHDAVFRPENPPAGVAPARIANPLAEDAAVLRSSGIPTLLRALEWNLNRGQRNLRLFELGRVYSLEDGKPVESPVLTLGAAGLAREKSIYDAPRAFGLEDLKGDLEVLLEICGGMQATAGGPAWLEPGRTMRVAMGSGGQGAQIRRQDAGARTGAADGALVGTAGQLGRRVAERFKLKQEVWLAELWAEPLYQAIERQRAARQYAPLPRFPAVERDFSLVLGDAVTFDRVVQAIRALGVPEIEDIEAVDLFRGGAIPKGKHSLLVRVTLQSHEATLTEARVNDVSGRIVSALERELGATLRTQ
jgi:phenylalanyl-tRNA synthetase beta chain